MSWPVSAGRVHEQHSASLEGGWPSPTTCVFPTREQAQIIAEILLERGLRAVSIGCGEGAFERCLEDAGVCVVGVDLDAFSDPSRYATMRCFLADGIVRVRPDELFLITEPAATCLCLIWGRTLPWRQYLQHYEELPLVCIVGEPAESPDEVVATQPAANALDFDVPGALGCGAWRLVYRAPMRAVHGGAVVSVYEREAKVACNLLALPDEILLQITNACMPNAPLPSSHTAVTHCKEAWLVASMSNVSLLGTVLGARLFEQAASRTSAVSAMMAPRNAAATVLRLAATCSELHRARLRAAREAVNARRLQWEWAHTSHHVISAE